VSGVDPLEVEAILDVDPLRAGSILSRNVRNSTANRLISPNISPDREYPSALFGSNVVTGVLGSLLDRECSRNGAGVTAEVGDSSDFTDSKFSPMAMSCRFALFSENSAATDNVYGEIRPLGVVPFRSFMARRRWRGGVVGWLGEAGLLCHGGAPGGTGNWLREGFLMSGDEFEGSCRDEYDSPLRGKSFDIGTTPLESSVLVSVRILNTCGKDSLVNQKWEMGFKVSRKTVPWVGMRLLIKLLLIIDFSRNLGCKTLSTCCKTTSGSIFVVNR